MSGARGAPRDHGASGSSTTKVAPRPGALRTPTRPPCASTTARTIDSPSPLPPWARVRAVSAR